MNTLYAAWSQRRAGGHILTISWLDPTCTMMQLMRVLLSDLTKLPDNMKLTSPTAPEIIQFLSLLFL